MANFLQKHPWWNFIHEDLRELLSQSFLLSDVAGGWRQGFLRQEEIHDYSFIVFPAAKAYEGFLKTLFLDLGFISKEDFYGKRFRIGKALNPVLEKRLRRKISVYDKLVNFCQSRTLADELWNTWKTCRNLTFHWFPDEKNALTYDEAVSCIQRIVNAMDLAYNECKTVDK
mgnify:FL=1